MPRIFDNIEQSLLPELKKTLNGAIRADFCVGYVNLRGWQKLQDEVEKFEGGISACCRLLVGMQNLPIEQVHTLFSLANSHISIDLSEANRLKKKYVNEFREQLTIGAPNNQDEAALRRLSSQLKAGKVKIKLFLRHALHAKLYLVYRPELVPIIGFLGSSNLTISGLLKQGELNVDVLDRDATKKLEEWFEDRWTDKFCLDITSELIEVIDESWAREKLTPPYHIYLKMAYHLSQEARVGLSEYRLPLEFRDRLFDFQAAAVKIAAHHVNTRGGVLIGDVVGLGKTLIGTALARILQDDSFLETLIICPLNLVPMWKDYVIEYRLIAEVIPISAVIKELPNLRRYRVVLIDESHNLRNREGKRYRAIREYISINECKCILLSATPYNKTYLDLSAQLRLFIPEDHNLGIRPEKLMTELGGEIEFKKRYQADVRSIKAFEVSNHTDDWRDLMKLFMVRRTRSFIKNNYAEIDQTGRRYLKFNDGSRSYFPTRIPKTAKFVIGDPANDPYAALYSNDVVDIINALKLPRYGLGIYQLDKPQQPPNQAEEKILDNLSHAGRRLMGFCRTNLFKRLESSGSAFIQSLDRHILRNYIYLHAVENNLDIPIGTQDAALLDTRNNDLDLELLAETSFDLDVTDNSLNDIIQEQEQDYQKRAQIVYQLYATRYKRRFQWIRPTLFKPQLAETLFTDAQALIEVLRLCPNWDASSDYKLKELIRIILNEHKDQKVLIFTQFADTAQYLGQEIGKIMTNSAFVTGNVENPTELAYLFSPKSNRKTDRIPANLELRVLITTDILSEGQNLQDCSVIVNYDLPWAIIRLIQRAGRIDRIGQESDEIICYSFLPTEGVERLINLRTRLQRRLEENAEVVGTDEEFFEGESDRIVRDLYNERTGIVDDDPEDNEVDLTSEAFQIWKNATEKNPDLKKKIEELPNVSYASRPYSPTETTPEGVLVYIRTSLGNDALAYVNRQGDSVTQSQLAILRLAACQPNTPALVRDPQHHQLVEVGTKLIAQDEKSIGGQLGKPSGARFRCYERLKRYAEIEQIKRPLFFSQDLLKVIDEIYRYPLRQSAIDTLNRHFKSGINDEQLAELVKALRMDDRLCIIMQEEQQREAQIICSMGLFQPGT